MSEFNQHENNLIDKHDSFVENKIQEEEKDSILKYIIIFAITLALIIGGYLLYKSFNKTDASVEKTEVISEDSNDTTTDTSTEMSTTNDDNSDASANNVVSDNSEANTDIAGTTKNTSKISSAVSEREKKSNSKTTNTVADTSLHYFVVSGVFSEEANAQKKVAKLKQAGHNAVITSKNTTGLYVVAYEGFATISEAKAKLKEIKVIQEDSWIYKK